MQSSCHNLNNLHGGIGKDFVASSLVEMMIFFDGAIPVKCGAMNKELRRWISAGSNRKLPYSGQFTAERVGFTS